MPETEECLIITLKDGGEASTEVVFDDYRGTIIRQDKITGKMFYSSIPQRTWRQSNDKPRRWEEHRSLETFIEDRQTRLAQTKKDYDEVDKLYDEAVDILKREIKKDVVLAFFQKTKLALKGKTSKQLSTAFEITKKSFDAHNCLAPTEKNELHKAIKSIKGLLEGRKSKISKVQDKYEIELLALENLLQPPACITSSTPEPF